MASSTSFARTLFAQATRSAFRTSSRASSKRFMSSAEHLRAPGNDRAWQIGSLLLFGPATIYLLTPSSRKPAHDAVEHHTSAHETHLPTKDDEGTEVSQESVDSAAKDAFNSDSPKDAQAAEEQPAIQESGGESSAVADAEGETTSEDNASKGTEGESEKEEAVDEQPTNIGEARKEAKEGEAPKEAKAEKEEEGH